MGECEAMTPQLIVDLDVADYKPRRGALALAGRAPVVLSGPARAVMAQWLLNRGVERADCSPRRARPLAPTHELQAYLWILSRYARQATALAETAKAVIARLQHQTLRHNWSLSRRSRSSTREPHLVLHRPEEQQRQAAIHEVIRAYTAGQELAMFAELRRRGLIPAERTEGPTNAGQRPSNGAELTKRRPAEAWIACGGQQQHTTQEVYRVESDSMTNSTGGHGGGQGAIGGAESGTAGRRR